MIIDTLYLNYYSRKTVKYLFKEKFEQQYQFMYRKECENFFTKNVYINGFDLTVSVRSNLIFKSKIINIRDYRKINIELEKMFEEILSESYNMDKIQYLVRLGLKYSEIADRLKLNINREFNNYFLKNV
jgi:hypothetical protein